MKRIQHLIPVLLSAVLLTGCGPESERLYQVDPADYISKTDNDLNATATAVPEPEDTGLTRMDEEPVGFDDITDEQALERLYSTGSNADYIEDYHTESANTPPEFREAGNGYYYYDLEMTEESVLATFDALTQDTRLLARWFVDDPEIKCIAYDFYAVKDNGDGTAELGWYCYLIDRDDHMFSIQPEWNQKRTIMLTDAPVPTLTEAVTEPETLSDAEIEGMAAVDKAVSELTDSDNWKQANVDTRRELVVMLLNKLADDGLITKNSIYADEDLVSFEYTGGARGGIKLTPFDPMMN